MQSMRRFGGLHKQFQNLWQGIRQWKNEKTSKKRHIARKKAYADLAAKLNIPVEECHFGYFDMDMLNKAYGILKGGGDIEQIQKIGKGYSF